MKNLQGRKFGRWLVLKRNGSNDSGRATWLCECQCNKKTKRSVVGSNLLQGKSTSCGCIQREKSSAINSKIKRKSNNYNLTGDFGVGYTSKGEEFYFDLEDYKKLNKYTWHINARGYVESHDNETKETIKLHNLILKTLDNFYVDHINRNPLDNKKENLRICTHQENTMNRSKAKNNTSGVTGVSWHKKQNQWISRIGYKNEIYYLGGYDSFDNAAKARLLAEKKYYKEFAPQKHLFEKYGIQGLED